MYHEITNIMKIYIETDENQDDEDKNRTYIVTAKFRISGFLPDKVTEGHIKSNIQSQMRDAVSEIDLSSEYYDGEDDEEWGIYLDSDIELEMEQIVVRIGIHPFCEHCGENHEDFGIEISDGTTSWCLDCYLSYTNNFLTKEDIKEIRSKFKELKKKHLLRELEELENDE